MFLKASDLEVGVGIEVYVSRGIGIGGRIRQFPEDFVVEEVLVDGSKASVSSIKILKPSGWGRYLLCLMVKRGWDTLLAVERIAKELGINSGRVRIAGIKDAKALTAQHITIGAVNFDKILNLKIDRLQLYPIRFVNEPISPSQLYGNRFKITIRDIPHNPATIKKLIKDVMDEITEFGGLPNYFGHQRFGTIRPITHLVGKMMVLGNLEGAVKLILSAPSSFESPRLKEARRRLIETEDYKSALKEFPKHLTYERAMLKYLSRHPRDHIGALRRLSVRLRRLFIEAYQSYLYNRFLSRRIMMGISLREAQIGDYVIKLNPLGLPTDEVVKASEENISEIRRETRKGKMVPAIPIIGFAQGTSDGIQGEIESSILEEEGIKPEDFKVEAMPEAGSSGSLRRTITPIREFRILGISEDSINQSKFKVELGFFLLRGSYATILLREIMKPEDPVEAGF